MIAVLLFVLAWNLVRSRTGRAMIAVRDQEIALPRWASTSPG